jgi:hypothetical protein
MTALGFAGVNFDGTLLLPEDIPKLRSVIEDLSLHPHKYGFTSNDIQMLEGIQQAFGFVINTLTHEVISCSMEEWWAVFETSRQGGLMEEVFDFFYDLITSTKTTKYYRDFRNSYFWTF